MSGAWGQLACGLVLLLALVVAWGLYALSRRLAAIEEELAALDRLADLEQRLDQLADGVLRSTAPAQLQDKLTRFAESIDRLTGVVAELRRAPPLAPPPAPGGPAVVEDLDEVVRRQLAARGYERVRLLVDAGTLAGGHGRMPFEAYRRGALHKGVVTVQSGVIVDENVRPAYAAFP